MIIVNMKLYLPLTSSWLSTPPYGLLTVLLPEVSLPNSGDLSFLSPALTTPPFFLIYLTASLPPINNISCNVDSYRES